MRFWIIGRTQTSGPGDYANVHKVQDGFKLVPLSAWGKSYTPPANVATDAGRKKLMEESTKLGIILRTILNRPEVELRDLKVMVMVAEATKSVTVRRELASASIRLADKHDVTPPKQ